MSGTKWTVELEPGVWLAHGKGDPPRTLRPEYAKPFANETAARRALQAARKFRPFSIAVVWEVICQ